jgi:hypothetical protein
VQRSRKAVSEADRRFIIAQSGGRCNKCRIELFVQNEFLEKARLGDDAHIVASSDYGPRSDADMYSEQRGSSDNLILLCKLCHSEVDQQPLKFTESSLLKIREDHYEWVRERLSSNVMVKPRFHYLRYINLPRADMYASATSIALPYVDIGNAKSIRDLGMGAGRLMANYTAVLNSEPLHANSILIDTAFKNLRVGEYWFVDSMTFRTLGIADTDNIVKCWNKGRSLIYKKMLDWTLECRIDPRWITTSTSFCDFTSGSMVTSGFIHVNDIDIENRRAICSPLFLGAPK